MVYNKRTVIVMESIDAVVDDDTLEVHSEGKKVVDLGLNFENEESSTLKHKMC